MTFEQFWNLYLRGHSMPGTRTIHYFATILGFLCALEAVFSRQLLFALGIAVSYALAIGAHWFVERNAPLIKVGPLWGMVADVKMCWLALRGELAGELDRAGIRTQGSPSPAVARPSRLLRWQDTAVAILATIGLAWSMSDLADLFEPQVGYDIVPLGVPLVAFFLATAAAFGTLARSRRRSLDQSARATSSLRRATVVLLTFGTAAFVAAEMLEHGAPDRPDLPMLSVVGVVAAIVCGALFLVLGGSKHADDPAEAFAASVVKVIGFLGSAAAAAAGALTLCWQAAPIITGGTWRSLSVADMIAAGPGHPVVLAWLLKAPGSLSFFALSFALLLLGAAAADRELTRRGNQLYAYYLAQARKDASRD